MNSLNLAVEGNVFAAERFLSLCYLYVEMYISVFDRVSTIDK